jgi:hypothetical protein
LYKNDEVKKLKVVIVMMKLVMKMKVKNLNCQSPLKGKKNQQKKKSNDKKKIKFEKKPSNLQQKGLINPLGFFSSHQLQNPRHPFLLSQ